MVVPCIGIASDQDGIAVIPGVFTRGQGSVHPVYGIVGVAVKSGQCEFVASKGFDITGLSNDGVLWFE